MNKLVFVYGSLKKDHWNHHYLETSQFMGEGVTYPHFVLTDCGFPYMIPSQSVSDEAQRAMLAPVVGEVYKVTDEAVIASLDRLEGVDYGHYEKQKVRVIVDGVFLTAETYVPVEKEMAAQYPVCNKTEEGYFQWT